MDINRVILSGLVCSVKRNRLKDHERKGIQFCLRTENSQQEGSFDPKFSYYDICVLTYKDRLYKNSLAEQIVKGRRVMVYGELKSISRTDALGNIYSTNYVMAEAVIAQN
ncbi:MAG: single-stranded DNA-binding protein [Succinivibrio sp.]